MTTARRTLKVWDMPTRIFHWGLVGVIGVAWLSSEGGSFIFSLHVVSGVSILGFIAFRLVWGVIGSRYARFGDFVHGPAVVKDYARRLFAFSPPHSVGHNPLGGWMVIALMVLAVLSTLSGLADSGDGYTGPLAFLFGSGGLNENVHVVFTDLLAVLIVLHIVGVLAHGLVSRENLPRAMVTGEKTIPEGISAEGIRSIGIVRPAIAVVVGVLVAVYFLNL